jgi:3-oxoacyl-[acyl-carrier protein] reductase
MRLEGKTALVTGGSRSIGRGISLALAREGADVAMNYVEDDEAAVWTVDRIRGMGRQAESIQADVGELEACKEIVRWANETFGQIDIFVNNAAIGDGFDIVDTSDELWERVINVNLRAAFALARELIPGMVERKFGRIVTISSALAQYGGGPQYQGKATYSASKAGLIALTKGMAHEAAPYVTANIVSPHGTDRRLAAERGDLWPPEPNEEDDKYFKKGYPLNRIGTPEDVAEAVLYLVSDSACYLTGQTIHVNGGHFMP